jgi:hypothetical protein
MLFNDGDFRIGWELEFQNSDYKGPSEDSLDRWYDEETDQLGAARISQVSASFTRYIRNHILPEDDDLSNYVYVSDLPEWAEPTRNYIVENYDEPDGDEYSLDLPYGVTVVSDGSVDGGEIRLDEPNDISGSIDKLKRLQDAYDFVRDLKVDEECSFHVHLSYQGIKHSYGEKFQMLLYEYILTNMEALPTSVLERWLYNRSDWLSRYFDIRISDNKYNFVAYRSEHCTWEFRCFGNIKTAEAGAMCINFAKDAYIWAKNRIEAGETSSYTKYYVYIEGPCDQGDDCDSYSDDGTEACESCSNGKYLTIKKAILTKAQNTIDQRSIIACAV